MAKAIWKMKIIMNAQYATNNFARNIWNRIC